MNSRSIFVVALLVLVAIGMLSALHSKEDRGNKISISPEASNSDLSEGEISESPQMVEEES